MIPKIQTSLMSSMMMMGAGPSGAGRVDLPLTIASLTEWLDYRRLSAVGDGNPISTWVGRKGVVSLASTGTTRPTYAADDGDGKAAAVTDGVNDVMSAAVERGNVLGATGDFEAWFVIRGQTNANSINQFCLFDGGPAINIQAQPAYTRINLYVGSQACFGATGDIQDNAWHVVRVQRTSASGADSWIDGVHVGFDVFNLQTWATGSCNLYLGGFNEPWLGAYRHALFFNALLDDATAASLTTYLSGV